MKILNKIFVNDSGPLILIKEVIISYFILKF